MYDCKLIHVIATLCYCRLNVISGCFNVIVF